MTCVGELDFYFCLDLAETRRKRTTEATACLPPCIKALKKHRRLACAKISWSSSAQNCLSVPLVEQDTFGLRRAIPISHPQGTEAQCFLMPAPADYLWAGCTCTVDRCNAVGDTTALPTFNRAGRDLTYGYVRVPGFALHKLGPD
ncbi:hypothetical protein CH063_09661 [Colletotrichum higginsianum]|uniref:Uncharacterized protein n=1 Tax=Colletotrichum higginsianum (strain IMI 349063) TaxID=759273 RepID=H1VEG3_COLHI|nr:hypothetical protein CH063_09661 [Colletotrichum higginsianum]